MSELSELKHRFEFKETQFKHLFPPEFEHFQTQKELVNAYNFIIEWKKERTWLLDIGADLNNFKNEHKFKELLEKMNIYRGLKILKVLDCVP